VKIKGGKIMDKQKAIRVISILLIVLLIATVSVTTVSAKYIIIKSKSHKTTGSPTSYGGNWAGPSNLGSTVPATYGGTATFGNQFASPHIIWVDIGGADDVSGFPDGLGGPCELSGYTVISGNYGIW
jgi:hypothetical protein